jgi:dTMP kinase
MPLLSFEGIDGSGKSTQIELLCTWLKSKNISVEVYREPGGTKTSESIRSLLLDKSQTIDPISELLLFSAARAQLISEKIVPALNMGKWVILDRFYDSTTAYQGYGRAVLPIAQIQQLNTLATNNLTPDITIYLDVDLSTSIERRKDAENDRMESAGVEFFQNVIEGYRKLAESESRIKRIDANNDSQSIHLEIIGLLNKAFKLEVA